MKTPSLLTVLALAACTPETARELVSSDLAGQVREHQAAFAWTEQPLAPGLEASYQVRTPRLRVYVSPDGLHAVDRAESAPSWTLDLVTDGYGRRGATRPVPRGSLWAEGRSAESVHGSVVEYAENTEDGLMHGFRLLEPPEGSGPVQLRMRVGGATAHATSDGALFVVDGKATVGWRGLAVFDADGTALAASTHVDRDHLVVEVDDTGARWPVTIDPLLATNEVTVDPIFGPTSPNRAGFSIAAEGDQIVLGNPGAPGGSTDGRAVLLERNTPSQDAWDVSVMFDQNGGAVAVDIDDHMIATSSVAGRLVRVYEDDDGWPGTETILRPSAVDLTDEYGADVSLFGHGIVVGAPGANAMTGKVYLYNHFQLGQTAPPTTPQPWGQTAEAFGSAIGDRFGTAVAGFGTRLVIGAPGADSATLMEANSDVASGGSGLTTLNTFRGTPGTDFGIDVAIHTEHVVVGAPGADEVRVYGRVGALWTSETVIEAPREAGPGFGRRVAVTSDTLAVTDEGAPVKVHLFDWTGDGWNHTHSLDTGGVGDPDLPVSVTLTDTILAVGLPLTGEGTIWDRVGTSFVQEELNVALVGDRLGEAVAVHGDLVVAGAPQADPNGAASGAAYVFAREPGGEFVLNTILEGLAANDRFGSAVDVAADVVVVGAPGASTDDGSVTFALWDGAAVVTQGAPRTTLLTNQRFGSSVATDGQLVLVGQPGTSTSKGSTRVYGRHTGGDDAFGSVSLVATEGFATNDQMSLDGAALSGTWLFASSVATKEVVLQQYDRTGPVQLDDSERLTSTATGFGKDIAAEGMVLAVAQDTRTNIYRYDPTTDTWPLEKGITSSPTSVSMADGRLVVGDTAAGTLTVYDRNQGGQDDWGAVLTQVLPAGGEAGFDVDVQGSTVVVGAPAANAGAGEISILTLDANLAPFCRDETLFAIEDRTLEDTVSANEHDPNGDTLTYTVTREPTDDLDFALSGDGVVTYRAEADYNGADSFTYRVSDGVLTCTATATITVVAVNDKPVAAADGPYLATEDTVFASPARTLLANDTDVDSTAFTAVVASSPSHGTLVVQANGTFTYTPEPNWFGDDTFTYRTLDDENAQSAPATVTITVAPVNDPPTYGATSLETSVLEDVGYVSLPPGLLDVAGDVDGDVLSTVLTTQAAHGIATIGSNGYWRYVPAANYHGPDEFTFAVTDGTVQTADVTVELTVEPVNDAPIGYDDGVFRLLEDDTFELFFPALLANDGDLDGDLLRVVVGPGVPEGALQVDPLLQKLTFVPSRDYFGPVVLTYRAQDPGGLETPDIAIRLEFVSVNDAPLATGDTVSSSGGDTATGNALANDSDPDGDPLTASLSSPPREGTATVAANGDFTYTPRVGFEGQDQFSYAAADPSGATVRAVVTINISDNDPSDTPTETPEEPVEDCTDPITWYQDQDRDGFGDVNSTLEACDPPGYVADATDCDDRDDRIFPNAREASGDGIDQDCDGRDNVPQASGTCNQAPGAPAAVPLALAALLLLRRRSQP